MYEKHYENIDEDILQTIDLFYQNDYIYLRYLHFNKN